MYRFPFKESLRGNFFLRNFNPIKLGPRLGRQRPRLPLLPLPAQEQQPGRVRRQLGRSQTLQRLHGQVRRPRQQPRLGQVTLRRGEGGAWQFSCI